MAITITLPTMGKMKNLHIETLNAQQQNSIQYSPDMSIEELKCMLHEDYINMVNESGIPLWVYEQYEEGMYNLHLLDNNQLEVDNLISTTELDFTEYQASEGGKADYEHYGNWFDAYVNYLDNIGYLAQEEDLDYLCRLNGFDDDDFQLPQDTYDGEPMD